MNPQAPERNRTFVGFGFGAIQAGLFVYEALLSGRFGRLVLAEIVPETVHAIREEGGRFNLNIAHAQGIESLSVGPVEIENPVEQADRERLVAALADASEVATAVPSVRAYQSDGPASLHRVLAEGLRRRQGRATIVYTAENHQRAAELLEEAVRSELGSDADAVLRSTSFVNTVIAKMSAVVDDVERIRTTPLSPVTAHSARAFLVESFNRILISEVSLPADVPYERGLAAFEEKRNLGPFEDTKLYGHNAVHALAAYLAALGNLTRMEELAEWDGGLDFVREALVLEAGKGLQKRWQGADALFTDAGFEAFADDLLTRMFNPSLGDLVARVARDPARKLDWEDRLVGGFRLALAADVEPWRLALGIAAALLHEQPGLRSGGDLPRGRLEKIWRPACPDAAEAGRVLDWVDPALTQLRSALGRGNDLFRHLSRFDASGAD